MLLLPYLVCFAFSVVLNILKKRLPVDNIKLHIIHPVVVRAFRKLMSNIITFKSRLHTGILHQPDKFCSRTPLTYHASMEPV